MTGATWKSFLVAALFAWHPLHVESVAWISERKDVLFTFFWILTMWAHWRYANHPSAKRNLLTLLFCSLALMAKPMAVTLPIVLLLMDIWPLKRFPKPIEIGDSLARQIRQLLFEKMTLFIAVLFTCILTFRAQQLSGAVKSLDRLPILPRITNMFISYISYLRMMVWPENLAVIYPHSHQLRLCLAIICLALFIAMMVWAFLAWRKHTFFSVGWLWYIITLIPVIGIIQVGGQALADRYTYIPLIGIFIMVSWGLGDLIRIRPFLKPLTVAGCCVAISLCLLLTRFQIYYWQDSMTLFTHTLRAADEHSTTHFALACAYFDEEQYESAEKHLSDAIRLSPENETFHIKLGLTFAKQGKFDKAFPKYEYVLQMNRLAAVNVSGLFDPQRPESS